MKNIGISFSLGRNISPNTTPHKFMSKAQISIEPFKAHNLNFWVCFRPYLLLVFQFLNFKIHSRSFLMPKAFNKTYQTHLHFKYSEELIQTTILFPFIKNGKLMCLLTLNMNTERILRMGGTFSSNLKI